MLHCSLLERYCPVRCIVPNRSRNLETARQFSIYNHFVVQIHVFCKFSFYRFFCCSIGKYIVLHIFLGKIRLRKVFIFFSCKYFRIIGAICLVIRNVIDDHGGLFFIDKFRYLRNEFFRIMSVHCKFRRRNPFQNHSNRFSSQMCPSTNFAHKIVLDLACFASFQIVCMAFF